MQKISFMLSTDETMEFVTVIESDLPILLASQKELVYAL